MIYKKNNLFFAIKAGKIRLNSIAKSIKTITLKEKSLFVLFSLNCTPTENHLKHCIFAGKGFKVSDFLMKLTGEKQLTQAKNRIELDNTKKACLIAVAKNKKKADETAKKISELIGLKKEKISSLKRLKKLAIKEKIPLNAFGEDFYSSVNNFFIERSALVVE